MLYRNYINRTMSCYYQDGNGMVSKMDANESFISNMIVFYELNLFFNFKYTKIFRKHYLPELCRHELLDGIGKFQDYIDLYKK